MSELSDKLAEIQKGLDALPPLSIAFSEGYEKRYNKNDELVIEKNPLTGSGTLRSLPSFEVLAMRTLRNGAGDGIWEADLYIMEGGKVESVGRKYRSFQDIYRLARTYFPDMTFEDVVRRLVAMTSKGHINYFFCGDIKRRVCNVGTGYAFFMKDHNTDELGLTQK